MRNPVSPISKFTLCVSHTYLLSHETPLSKICVLQTHNFSYYILENKMYPLQTVSVHSVLVYVKCFITTLSREMHSNPTNYPGVLFLLLSALHPSTHPVLIPHCRRNWYKTATARIRERDVYTGCPASSLCHFKTWFFYSASFGINVNLSCTSSFQTVALWML